MRKIFTSLYFVCLSFIASAQSPDPSIVSSAGGEGRSSTIWLQWTLGEPVTTTVSSSGKIYTQGFNQPMVTVRFKPPITVTAEVKGLSIGIAPNPVHSILTIRISSKSSFRVESVMTTTDGKNLYHKIYTGTDMMNNIDMSNLAAGNYYLSFYTSAGLIKTFKIIKE